MYERIQKIISTRGVMSRRAAEAAIIAGRVTLNGNPASLGDKADPETDTIAIDGKPLRSGDELTYIVLNKPRGYVTTMSDERGRKTVSELVADCGVRVYPVGRLDYNSEGLLIMTNDGNAAFKLMHPSFESEKTYKVTVSGNVSSAVPKLSQPMEIDGYKIGAAKIKILEETAEKSIITVTIHEGRNRQVRKMCAKVGLEVRRLVRISEGNISLGRLKTGKWRFMTEQEIEYINSLTVSENEK